MTKTRNKIHLIDSTIICCYKLFFKWCAYYVAAYRMFPLHQYLSADALSTSKIRILIMLDMLLTVCPAVIV